MRDGECGFLVLFSFKNGNKDFVFVAAERVGDAIAKALEKRTYLRDAAAFSVEAFVVDPNMFKDIVPVLKKVARQYWDHAIENTGLNRGEEVEDEYFEATWKDHGIDASD